MQSRTAAPKTTALPDCAIPRVRTLLFLLRNLSLPKSDEIRTGTNATREGHIRTQSPEQVPMACSWGVLMEMMMTDLDMVLEAGSILLIETGCYSDFGWHGPVKMLVSKTKRELADEFRSDWKADPKMHWATGPYPSDFLPWMVKKGYAEDFACHAWHVGEYSRFEP